MSARQLSPVKSSPEDSRVSSICSEEKTSASTRVSPARILYVVPTWCRNYLLTGILPQKKFYCPNLIFWIVMGCGKARFGRKGQKPLEVENFVLWDLMCGSPGGPREKTLRPKFSTLGVFLALLTETSITTPHY